MEATKRWTAEEERRLKLLEYLAAKGKLKPQNPKPYLKDCTNLQNKRPHDSSKQIWKPKSSAPNKGSHFTFGSSRSKALNAGPLPHQSSSGKVPTRPTVSAKRLVSNASSRNPLPLKCSLPRVRPEQRDHSGRTLHPPSVPGSRAKKQEREESDVTLTVILTKKHGEKPEICVVDETSPTARGQCASGLCASVQQENGQPGIALSKQVPATKAISQAAQTKSRQDPKMQPTASKPVSVASSGHIRIVSRSSLPEAKSVHERSFLIKSTRYDSSKQPLNVHKSQHVDNPQRTTCPTAKYSSAVTSCTMLVHKKISTGPVSAPSRRPHSSDCTSKRISYSQNTLDKPIAPRKSIAPPGCKKVVSGSKDEDNKQNRERKQQGVTAATKEAITKASNLTDTASRPQTPRMTVEDRKKKLQEWLNSKGKTYKRPPMLLPPKRPPTAKKQNPNNRSLWEGIEEEEELLALSKKIRQTLSECLELIEKGVSVEDIHAALDKVPEAKRFAKYWVCKARLLEREGTCDVMDVYKQGVQFGATPLDELREVVFDIMKNTNKKTKVVTFGPLPAEEVTESEIHEDISLTPFRYSTEQVKTPCTGTSVCDQGSAVKLHVTSLSSKKKISESGQEWKRLTPVRRSVRIHHSASQYPAVVQEHDTVVSCLEELLDKADAEAYLYMRNEALPEETEHNLMSLRKKDPTEGQHEGPV